MNKFQKKMLEAAIGYADRGWRVLPVAKQSKQPLVADWTNAATTDDRTLAKWWVKYPSANIGIATGPGSGFFVVDIDCKGEADGFASLGERFGTCEFDWEEYLVSRTPTGGVHLFFRWRNDLQVRTSAGVLPGVDLRGVGGQVVVAPSARNIEGEWAVYEWNDPDLPLCEPLPWVEELVRLAAERKPGRFDLKKVMTGLTEGERDDQITRYAAHLRGRGIDYSLAVGFMREAVRRCEPPFDENLALEKLERAYTALSPADDLETRNRAVLDRLGGRNER